MYKRRDSISKLFDLKMRMVDKLSKEISECTRYPKDSILRDKGYVLIDVDVFKDYLFYRKQLKNEVTSKLVPKYIRNQMKYLDLVD